MGRGSDRAWEAAVKQSQHTPAGGTLSRNWRHAPECPISDNGRGNRSLLSLVACARCWGKSFALSHQRKGLFWHAKCRYRGAMDIARPDIKLKKRQIGRAHV